MAHLRTLLPHLGLAHCLINCCRLLCCAVLLLRLRLRLRLLLLGCGTGLARRLRRRACRSALAAANSEAEVGCWVDCWCLPRPLYTGCWLLVLLLLLFVRTELLCIVGPVCTARRCMQLPTARCAAVGCCLLRLLLLLNQRRAIAKAPAAVVAPGGKLTQALPLT
jgi:hypothetical protein